MCFASFDDREDELNEWLEQLLYLQQGRTVNFYGKKPKPTFENVYQVTVSFFCIEFLTFEDLIIFLFSRLDVLRYVFEFDLSVGLLQNSKSFS